MSGPSVTNFFTDSNILTAGSNINGGWESVSSDYILISIDTDTETSIQLQHSHDSITVDYTDSVAYNGSGEPQNYIYSRKGEYIQIRLENTSGSDQTELRCYREFIGLPETSNVFNSNLYTQIETTNSLLDGINSNITGTIAVEFAAGSNVIVDQQNAANLHVLSHGSNDGGSTALPILVSSTGALVTTGGGTSYPQPLVSVSITNDPTVLRNSSCVLRGYHVTSALDKHAIVGIYDSNNANAVTASSSPIVRIPVSRYGDISLMLDGGGVAFSNGITIRGCSTFDLSRNVHVANGLLAGSFYYST